MISLVKMIDGTVFVGVLTGKDAYGNFSFSELESDTLAQVTSQVEMSGVSLQNHKFDRLRVVPERVEFIVDFEEVSESVEE